jgi:hypothetical protein
MIFSSLNRLCFMALPPSSIQKWKIPVRNGPDLGGKVRSGSVGGRVLLGQYHPAVAPFARRLESERHIVVEIKKTTEIHDRVLFVDSRDAWLMGASIKDAGKKPTYLMPLSPELGAKKLEIYNSIWNHEKHL